MTTPPSPPDHLGRVQKVASLLAFLAGGAFALIKLGIWIGEMRAPPVAVSVPPELAAQFDACRALVRALEPPPPRKDAP